MPIRDRIRELRRVAAAELRPNPRNWRTHPPRQRELLTALLAEIGFADALLARELADGSLELVDGHLRSELADEAIVPVLVLDVSEEEANKLLLSLDPLTALAETDSQKVRELLDQVNEDDPALRQLFAELENHAPRLPEASERFPALRPEVEIPEMYQIIVQCNDEVAQRELYERLKEEGYRCRVLMV